MGTNATDFGRRLEAFARRVEAKSSEAARKITLDALAGCVNKTPVDTGRARANWQVSALTPILTELDLGFTEPVRVVGRGKAATKERKRNRTASNRFNAQQAARLALAAGEAAAYSVDRVTVMYLSNNVNYIQYLENGSSRQAPQGMLRLTVQELVSRGR